MRAHLPGRKSEVKGSLVSTWDMEAKGWFFIKLADCRNGGRKSHAGDSGGACAFEGKSVTDSISSLLMARDLETELAPPFILSQTVGAFTGPIG